MHQDVNFSGDALSSSQWRIEAHRSRAAHCGSDSRSNQPTTWKRKEPNRPGVDANTGAPERDLLKNVSRLEEAELCRFLLELSLLDSAYRLPAKDADDVLLSAAKRWRIDGEKIEKEVAQKFSPTRKKSGNKPNENKTVA